MMIFPWCDDYALAVVDDRVEVRDTRNWRTVLHDCDTLFYHQPGVHDGGVPAFVHPVIVLYPRGDATGAALTFEVLEWRVEVPGTARGVVRYADGVTEHWDISFDARAQRLCWQRRTEGASAAATLRVLIARATTPLQLWQTGMARQLINEAVPGVNHEMAEALTAADERELLYYSARARNCALFQSTVPGTIEIGKTEVALAAGIEESNAHAAWDIRWHLDAAPASTLYLSLGVVDVTRNYQGRMPINLPDVTADLGPIFSRIFLACLPLNLRDFGGYLAPRCNVLIGKWPAYYNVWSRDVAYAYDMLYPLDPPAITRLLADYLALAESRSQSDDPSRSPVMGNIGDSDGDYGYWDDAAAEILIMAGRHYRLTGDVTYLRQHLAFYHCCADHLLSLRPEGNPLPLTRHTWDAQGRIIGIEPYFTAHCYAGLHRLAELEQVLGEKAAMTRYRDAAEAMKAAALRDYRDGGLWHGERGTFINHVDYRDPRATTPEMTNWSVTPPESTGVIRDEFALYQTLVPIWWGLLDDPAAIRRAYAWIDAHYTYASGGGEITYPPFSFQNFVYLLDVGIRHRHGIPGADRLLQLLMDRAMDVGIPLCENQFGTLGGHPMVHAGRIWDNSIYFGLFMRQHYGLDYTFHGWRIHAPCPIGNYPCTQLHGLRHGHARFTIRWQGTGEIARILVDGTPWDRAVIDLVDGEHVIEVVLRPS